MVTTNSQKFEAGNLPTSHVTVFSDRAEVCKLIKCHVNNGVNEIIVEKLSNSIDSNSIRVEGHGANASIAEVKFSETPATIDEEVKNRDLEQLHEKRKKLKDTKKTLENTLERSKRQKEILDGLSRQFGTDNVEPCANKEKASSVTAILTDPESLTRLGNFLDFYVQKVGELDKANFDTSKDLEKIADELSVVERKIRDVGGCGRGRIKQVSIAVHAKDAADICLTLSYLVWNASWKPSYDVRVQNEPAAVKVIYYGQIWQHTGEDWNKAQLTLSTASPVLGGQIPELKTTKVNFYKPPPPAPMPGPRPMMACSAMYAVAESAQSNRVDFGIDTSLPRMTHFTSNVSENVTSTKFDIVVPTTIPSDNSSHKVTIAMVDLEPKFEYESVPAKSAYAYFKAKVINSSDYPFLAGPTSIFFRDSFVAKGEMKSANPKEKFEVSLGVDPSVKVEYKVAEKFHEESGLINKCHLMTHEQKISLNNTKAEPLKIKVVESLPLSSDEKLKVNLIEPALAVRGTSEKLANQNAHLNKSNNVEWLVDLKAGEKRVLVLKYQIEYPKTETLEYKEE